MGLDTPLWLHGRNGDFGSVASVVNADFSELITDGRLVVIFRVRSRFFPSQTTLGGYFFGRFSVDFSAIFRSILGKKNDDSRRPNLLRRND